MNMIFVFAALLGTTLFVDSGSTVEMRPGIEKGGDYRGYSLFGYLKDMPYAVREVDPSRIKWNKREPLYSSYRFAGFKSGKTPPETVCFNTVGLPEGDYRVNVQAMFMENGKDRYRPYPVDFAVRNRERAKAPAEAFAAPEGTLAVAYVPGFCGDPSGALDVDVPWESGFSAPKKTALAEVQTKFKIFHDNDWLYLGIVCNEPDAMDKVKALGKRDHDSIMIVREESLEINVVSAADGMEFFKLGVRPTGDVADYRGEDDNTGTGNFRFDIRRESNAKVKTRLADRGWVAEIAIPMAFFSTATDKTAENGEWRFCLGRSRFPKKHCIATVWPAGAKGFCAPDSFAKMSFQNFRPDAHKWEFDLERSATEPQGGKLNFSASASVINRTGDFRFAFVRALLKDVNGKVISRSESRRFATCPGRVTKASVTLNDAPRGAAALHLELLSAEKRLEAQLTKDVRVEYEPVKIVLSEPCYRDCIFETMKLESVKGVVLVEEGVGKALTLSLTGEGTDEKIEFPEAKATNEFVFAFKNKAKGDYFLRAGGAVKRLRNLFYKPGEVWIDKDGVMYRDGRKFLPFGFFSDQYTENYPGITVSQMYTSAIKTPEQLIEYCRKCGEHNRGFIVRPQQMIGTNGKKLFDTKGEQGQLTEAQKAQLKIFAETAREQPWFMAYYMCDEPEGRDLNPEWFRAAREYMTEIDPYHPTMVLNYSIDGTIRYREGGDINCPDAYLVYYTDGTSRTPRRISYDKALTASTHALSSAWIAPQLFDWPDSSKDRMTCGPTYDQIRDQAMLALAGDVRGFLWYTHYSYGGAFTEHMRMGPKAVLDELLESRDVFLSPTVKGAVKVKSSGPDKTFIAALKRFGGESLLIACNTSGEKVTAEFKGAELPAKLYPNGAAAPVAVAGGKFLDDFAPYETKVYYSGAKKFDYVATRKAIYDAEQNRRRPGNLAAASKILTYKETTELFRKMPENWYPRIVASSTQKVSYDLPFTYFLHDGLRDELPIVPYLTWSPVASDKSPWVRVEFGAKKRFSKLVLYRCRDAEGRLALLSGKVEANGREIAAFADRENARIEIALPETEADSVTVKIGDRDAAAKCRLLSEIEAY